MVTIQAVCAALKKSGLVSARSQGLNGEGWGVNRDYDGSILVYHAAHVYRRRSSVLHIVPRRKVLYHEEVAALEQHERALHAAGIKTKRVALLSNQLALEIVGSGEQEVSQ